MRPAMSATPELAALQAQIDELRAAVTKKKRYASDTAPMVQMRVRPAEMALIDAAADAQGISRAQLLRQCVISALGIALAERHETPAAFRKMHARRKRDRDRFKDGKTDTGQIERADASRRAARKITMLNLEASAIAREFGDARDARNTPGLLAETVKKF